VSPLRRMTNSSPLNSPMSKRSGDDSDSEYGDPSPRRVEQWHATGMREEGRSVGGCVCVCVWQGGREGGREGEIKSVCVYSDTSPRTTSNNMILMSWPRARSCSLSLCFAFYHSLSSSLSLYLSLFRSCCRVCCLALALAFVLALACTRALALALTLFFDALLLTMFLLCARARARACRSLSLLHSLMNIRTLNLLIR